MITFFSLCIASLFAVGVWLILSRDWLSLVIGVGVVGHGINLLLLQSGAGEVREALPQALILTAIVIGAGLQAVLLILACLGYRQSRQRDTDDLPEELQ